MRIVAVLAGVGRVAPNDVALVEEAHRLAGGGAWACIGLGDDRSEIDDLLGAARAKGGSAMRVWAPTVETVDYLGQALLLGRAVLHDAGVLEVSPALATTGEHPAQHELSAEEEFGRESTTGDKTRPRFIAPSPEAPRRPVDRTWGQPPPADTLLLSADPLVGPAVAEMLGIPHWGRVRSLAAQDGAVVVERRGRGSADGAPWTPALPCLLVTPLLPAPNIAGGKADPVPALDLPTLDLTPTDLLHRRNFRLRHGAVPVAAAIRFTDADALVARLLADEALV